MRRSLLICNYVDFAESKMALQKNRTWDDRWVGP